MGSSNPDGEGWCCSERPEDRVQAFEGWFGRREAEVVTILHSSFRIPIAAALFPLRERYGLEPKLKMYDPPEGDTSLGSTEGTTISMNAFWFAEPIDKLREAAAEGNRTISDLVPTWHGGMPEPDQFVTHEMGHVLWNAKLHDRPEFQRFVQEGYAAALADPASAVSGYSLAHPDEFWAEVFCAAEIGGEALAANPHVAKLRELLEGLN